MHKNLMGKLIKSNNVNRGEYVYIYADNKVCEIIINGGNQYSRNISFDGDVNENASVCRDWLP